VWAIVEPGEGAAKTQPGWYTVPLGFGSRPFAEAERIADVRADLGLVALRAVRGAYALVTTSGEGAQRVDLRRLDARGVAVGAPSLLAESRPAVLWLDVLNGPEGGRNFVVLRAERQENRASIIATEIGEDGRAVGERELARDVLAWQSVSLPTGPGVGVVAGGAEAGSVELVLWAPGRAPILRLPIARAGAARPDLDVVRAGDYLLWAWTGRDTVDPFVATATSDLKGQVTRAPETLGRALGGEALLRLVPPNGGQHGAPSGPAFIAWERALERPARGRAVRLAELGPAGPGAARALLKMDAGDQLPELAANARGLAALTLAPGCQRSAAAPCDAPLPTFVELDRDLRPLASEPFRLEPLDGAGVLAAWGLACPGDRCGAFAAVPSTPAPVFWVELAARSRTWAPPLDPLNPDGPPRIAELTVLSENTDVLNDVALTHMGGRAVAASVTHFDPSTPWVKPAKPAPDGRFAPVRALLSLATRGPGEPWRKEVLSYRAHSLGGVSLAAHEKDALLGWTALDNGVVQVFVTLLDETGRKRTQKMLTRSPGEKSDVAIAAVADGWIVAWVSARSGDPEVYALKLGSTLLPAGKEVRITQAPGAATDLALLPVGDRVLVAWAAASGAPPSSAAPSSAGQGMEPHHAVLAARDAGVIAPDRVLRATGGASAGRSASSLALGKLGAAGAERAFAAWIEAAAGNAPAELKLVELDGTGQPSGDPTSLAVAGATALRFECAESACRGLLASEEDRRAELNWFTWTPGTAPELRPAARSGAPAVVAFAGREALVGDRDEAGRGRVRWVAVEW
jgi:hypothetical protein